MSQLRDLQLAELEILRAVANVCDTYGITYYLNSGTLLGAVRHGGFIPWDDDVDICMQYSDYERFLQVASIKLGEKFFVQNMETDPNFNLSYTKIRLNGTTVMNSYQAGWDIHHGVWIDIFPIVPLRGRMDFRLKHLIFSLCNFIQIDYCFNEYYYKEYYELVGRSGMALLRLFFKIPRSKRIKLHKLIIRYICNRKLVKCCSVLWGNITTYYPENVFAGKTTILFEGYPFSAPGDPDKYLTVTYGDYMQLPPEEKRQTHEIDIIDLENDYHLYLEV